MDSGEEADEEDDDEEKKRRRRGEEVQFYGRAGGLKERMGKENPSGRYVLHYMYLHVPTYLGR